MQGRLPLISKTGDVANKKIREQIPENGDLKSKTYDEHKNGLQALRSRPGPASKVCYANAPIRKQ